MEILEDKFKAPEGMSFGSEYCLSNGNTWRILTENGLEPAIEKEANYNQTILETQLNHKGYDLADVNIGEARFTHENGVRGIINFTQADELVQIRI